MKKYIIAILEGSMEYLKADKMVSKDPAKARRFISRISAQDYANNNLEGYNWCILQISIEEVTIEKATILNVYDLHQRD